MATLEDTMKMTQWGHGSEDDDDTVELLPDPDPRPRRHVLISVDDHLVEPGNVFLDRVPARYRDRAPRMIEEEDGRQYWLIDGGLELNVGGNAMAGRPADAQMAVRSMRVDEMRRGVWDIHERIRDMDINGIWASLSFPSMVFGFAGQRFFRMRDPKLGHACMQAYNDWVIDEWTAPYPDRIIPAQVTWLLDADLAAAEIERNAARGFKAVNFSENPYKLGLPSIHSGYWDPFFRACEETETVVNLHIGSSSEVIHPSPDAPVDTIATLFSVNAQVAAADWVFSGVLLRFPKLKVALSEGGIGWVPMMLDRLEYQMRKPRSMSWKDKDVMPADVLRRNFWFASFFDPSTIELRHRIGVDKIMIEADYPHIDGTWPDTQSILDEALSKLPENEARMVACENAAALYRHPLPPSLDFAAPPR